VNENRAPKRLGAPQKTDKGFLRLVITSCFFRVTYIRLRSNSRVSQSCSDSVQW